jgi:hypothetical protein
MIATQRHSDITIPIVYWSLNKDKPENWRMDSGGIGKVANQNDAQGVTTDPRL